MTSGQESGSSPRTVGASAPNDSSASRNSDRRRSWRRLAWAIVVGVVVLACVVVAFVLSRGDSSVGLSSTYDMTYDNLTYDIQTDGSLTEVTQDENGDIRGQITVGPGLHGTGSFTGTFSDGTIDFVTETNGVYTGTISSKGVLSGTYVAWRTQRGEWTATPTETEAASEGLPWWLWLAVAGLVVAVIGSLIVRVRRRRAHDLEGQLPQQ